MFLQESIQHCRICEERTPHSHRALALPKWVCAVLVAGAAWCFFQAMAWWVLGGLFMLSAVLVLLQFERNKFWSTHCERCRFKKLAAARRTKIRLDGSTEVFFLS